MFGRELVGLPLLREGNTPSQRLLQVMFKPSMDGRSQHSHTVDLTTAAHINLLRETGLLPDSELLEHGRPVPSGDQWSGVYIDDWLLARVVDRFFSAAPSEDTRRAPAVSNVFSNVGLPEEVSKQFNQSSNFKSWGVLVRGGCGTVGGAPEVRSQIFWLGCCLVSLGGGTKRILQQFQGLCAAAWIIRSEFICIFTIVIVLLKTFRDLLTHGQNSPLLLSMKFVLQVYMF